MMRTPNTAALLALALTLQGCPNTDEEALPLPARPPAAKPPAPKPAPSWETPPLNNGNPQTGLPVLGLEAGGVKIEAEVAATPLQRQIGLMYRTSLAANCGMLFVYPDRQLRSFWMKNTLIPLSIAYIHDNGVISDIIHMEPASEEFPITYPSAEPVRFALEMEQGWFAERGLGPGSKILGLEGVRTER